MFMLNISFIYRAIWALVKGILDPVTQRKIQIVEKGSKELFAFINPSQIEAKYGGTARDVTSNYFPHIIPSNDYFVSGEDHKSLLISEDQYREKVESDERIEKSPYYVPTPPVQFIIENEVKSEDLAEKVTKFTMSSNETRGRVFSDLTEEANSFLPIKNEFCNDLSEKNQRFNSLKQFFKPICLNVPKENHQDLFCKTNKGFTQTLKECEVIIK